MSPFTDVSFKQFMDSARTYFDATEHCSVESVTNGFKALTLLYYGHSDTWSHEEVNESVEIIKSAARRMISVERKNE